jgi:hypothetical protein
VRSELGASLADFGPPRPALNSVQVLCQIIDGYVQHMSLNPSSFLTRFLGCYSVKA